MADVEDVSNTVSLSDVDYIQDVPVVSVRAMVG